MQNAVDACNARKYIAESRGEEYFPLVKIDIAEDAANKTCIMKITDNGIGMDEDILLNYFLKAGSSFRKSTIWQKTFLDDEGHAQVQRSGKFGIGVLAAFLLGVKIHRLGQHHHIFSVRQIA